MTVVVERLIADTAHDVCEKQNPGGLSHFMFAVFRKVPQSATLPQRSQSKKGTLLVSKVRLGSSINTHVASISIITLHGRWLVTTNWTTKEVTDTSKSTLPFQSH